MADEFTTDRRRLDMLVKQLTDIVEKDNEQEVTGPAVSVVDAVVSSIRVKLPDDVVVSVIRDVISVEAIEEGEPVRALDLLVIVGQLQAALGPEPPPAPTSTPTYFFDRPGWMGGSQEF